MYLERCDLHSLQELLDLQAKGHLEQIPSIVDHHIAVVERAQEHSALVLICYCHTLHWFDSC